MTRGQFRLGARATINVALLMRFAVEGGVGVGGRLKTEELTLLDIR